MVNQITDEAYTNNDYQEYYDQFPFSLSPFQKFAIEAIVTGNHSLSCVPTGSGKTLPALFAIDFFTSQTPRKKVIYIFSHHNLTKLLNSNIKYLY